MYMKPVFARGARGELIRELQAALKCPATGAFDAATESAVEEFQAKANPRLPLTGTVDSDLWVKITGKAWPDQFHRLTQVVGAFEDHGYGRATNDWDGAGITWGLIGFTLIYKGGRGKLWPILHNLVEDHYPLVERAFGVLAPKLKEMLAATVKPDALWKWTREIRGAGNTTELLPPWQKAFAKLGEEPDVQAMQWEAARSKFYLEAVTKAASFEPYGMKSERLDLFLYDLQVNAGSLLNVERDESIERIKKMIAQGRSPTLTEKLMVIAEVHALERSKNNPASGTYKDIIARRGGIAHGYAEVHKADFRFDCWGVDVDDPPPVPPALPAPRTGSAVLSFEDKDQQEQLQLAKALAARGLIESSVEVRREGRWPGDGGPPAEDRGISFLTDATSKTQSASMHGLLGRAGGVIGRDAEQLLHAIKLMFLKPVEVLALRGNFTRPLGATGAGDHLLLTKAGRSFVGLILRANGQLHLVARRPGRVEEYALDVTEIRNSLKECSLLILYGSNGIPAPQRVGSGVRVLQWLKEMGASPIVLGWYGTARTPEDSENEFVAENFFTRLNALKPNADLKALVRDFPEAIVQQWGEACHQTFSKKKQRYLWTDIPASMIQLSQSGCAAITPDGQVWNADSTYPKTAFKAMKAVTL